jgi:hypothetical protein
MRARRSSTLRDTARGPISCTTRAFWAVGSTFSAASAVSSCRTSSGLPPVVSWQAAQNAGSASPSRSPTSAATPAWVSGAGRM